MKSISSILLGISLFSLFTILVIKDFNNTKLLINHQQELVSIRERISMVESNHIQLVESIVKWTKDDERIDSMFMDRVKMADDILDGKIQKLSEFDTIVIERLKAISESQKGLIQVIIGLGATNSVDNAN